MARTGKKKKKAGRKQRVKQEAQVPFPVLLGSVLVSALVLGLSYMWIDVRCDALGRQIKQREAILAAAQKRVVNEQDRWSFLTSPVNLRRAIQKWNLNMSMPEERQIVRVRYLRKAFPDDALAYGNLR
jgi:hypothetical protein